MNPSDTRLNTNILLVAAAFVIVIAGVKSAASILIPFLLSIFIAILSAPVMRWLTRHRVPEIVAVILILVGFLLFGTILATFVGRTINAFYQDMPLYESKLQALVDQSVAWLQANGVQICWIAACLGLLVEPFAQYAQLYANAKREERGWLQAGMIAHKVCHNYSYLIR